MSVYTQGGDSTRAVDGPRGPVYTTREEWLNAAVEAVRPWFDAVEAPLPEQVRVSCGFPGGGSPRKRIGECWSRAASADGVHNVFVSPILADLVDVEQRRGVLEVVVHELVHVADDNQSGHTGRFLQVATALGLDGKMTATTIGPELMPKLIALAEELGPYPHSAIRLGAGRKTQSTRMLKVECPYCGYTVRTTRKWLEVGVPHCPAGDEMELVP